MKLSTILPLVRTSRLRTLAFVMGLSTPYYRACFLISAASSGLLPLLAKEAAPLADVAAGIGVPASASDRLAAWLDVGVRLGVLDRRGDRYGLGSRLARLLADAANDDALAMLEEMVGLHRELLLQTPARLRDGRLFTLADQDGKIIARSSRILEPLVREAVDAFVPSAGRARLLEIGCGSGTYVRHALGRNPDLDALGLELQPEVAAFAADNLRAWGLADRARVETGDIRDRTPDPSFDLATLHNNIYYFPVAARVALLQHLRSFLVPGGRLLLTTGCRGGTAGMELLSLWGAVTEGCGPLPEPEALCAEMREAGFADVEAHNLLAPMERYFAFTGTNPR